MRRATLGIASLGVATATCLAVVIALREPPARDAVPAPAAVSPESAAATEGAEAPGVAAAPPVAPGAKQREAEAALAAEAEEEALRDALSSIDAADDVPLAGRLDRWQQALDAARDTAPYAPIFEFPTMLVELFLRMDSVQRELAALGPKDRAAELARIRRELGFDDDQITRAAQLDDRRESRWQNGLAYMEERARLVATFEGDALDTELRELRRDRFGFEAPTIEREERDGFYRYERPRIYGRN